MAFEQYKFTQTRQVLPADMSEARVWESLANTMDRFASQMGSINNANAAKAKNVQNKKDDLAGMQAGTIAGSEGSLDFMEAGNAFNDSYNRGIQAAYEAGITNQINNTLSTALQENPLDADAFATEAMALDKVLTNGKGEYETALIRTTLNRLAKTAQLKINANVQTQVKEGQVADILTANQSNIEEMGDMAYLGQDSTALMENFELRNEAAVDAGLISAIDFAKQKITLADALVLRSTMGSFDRLLATDGIAAAKSALAEYKADPTSIDAPLGKNLDLINSLEDKVRGAEALAKIQVEKAIKEFESGNTSLNIEVLKESVKGTALEAPLINAQNISVASAAFKGYNFVQMDIAEQNALKLADSPTKEALLKNYAEIRKETKELLVTDPYTLALKNNKVAGTKFDLTNPETLQARVVESQAASEFYGVTIPPLSQAEADGLRFMISEGNVENNMAIFQQLATGFGSETDEVFKLMFKDGGGAFAAASGMMLQGDADTTKLILKGQDLIKDDTYPNIIKTSNTQSSINTLIDTAFAGAYVETPNHIEILRSGIRAAYAQLSVENGKYDTTDDGIDESILENAIDKVTGGIVELEWQDSSGLISGFSDENYSIEVPRAGMDSGDVEDWMESITEADIDSMGGVANMKSAEVAKIINDGRAKLHSVGHGQYTLRNMTGNWFVSTDANGDAIPFVLTYIPPPPVSAKVAVPVDLDIDPAKPIIEQVLTRIEVNEDDPIDEMEASILGDDDFLNLRDLAGELEDQ